MGGIVDAELCKEVPGFQLQAVGERLRRQEGLFQLYRGLPTERIDVQRNVGLGVKVGVHGPPQRQLHGLQREAPLARIMIAAL